jgi:hypothetical protein
MASKKRPEYWAPRISAEWRKSVEAIIGVGRQLIAAKAACKGEYMRLFKGHDNPVSEPLPFTANTAERIMAVARHPILSDSAHVQTLPQSWGTLYELTKVPEADLAEAIAAGKITPEITRSQAVALHADPIDNSRLNWRQAAVPDSGGIVRIPRWLAALARWSDGECSRLPLGAVSIESDGFNATAVATDGRRIAVVTTPQSESMDERLPRVPPFLVAADELAKAIKKVPPKWKPGTRLAEGHADGSEHFVTIEANGDGTATVAAADGSGSPVTINLTHGRYPNWRDAIDIAMSDDRCAPTLKCNPAFLADVSFLAKAANAEAIAVQFTDDALLGEFETLEGCVGRIRVMGLQGQSADDIERENSWQREGIAAVNPCAADAREPLAYAAAATA